MVKIKDLTKEQLKQFFEGMGEKPFRAKQVFQWIYRGVTSFDEMTDLSKKLREKLKTTATLESPILLRVQRSKTDGTRKYLLQLSNGNASDGNSSDGSTSDGNTIESVFMKYNYGNSICVSSQAGCRMGCLFCASAEDGIERNLTLGEMADQILVIKRDTKENISHIVIMGTGEPLDNYGHVCNFIKSMNDPLGLNISLRNITLSTCGLIPEMEKLAQDLPQINLAVSLHSADETTRSSLMPINKKYPMKKLLAACRKHTEKTGRQITFEYALIAGVNDTKEQIDLLVENLSGMLCHVNLIPLNKVTQPNQIHQKAQTSLVASSRKQAREVAEYLERRGLSTTVRRELGSDIDGACGQLRLGTIKK